MQNVSAHLLRPGTGLQLQPAVASSQLAAQGQPAAAYQSASVSAHLQLSGMMERFTDSERKQLAFSVLLAGASVLSSAQQQQQQPMQAAAVRPGSVQGSLGCRQLDLGSCSRTGTPASLQAASVPPVAMRDAGHAYYASKCVGSLPVQSRPQQSGCYGQRVQGTMPAALEDSTSPLSSNSFAFVAGILTPCGADAVSASRVGCKRSYDAVEQQQQQQQYQQVLLSQHQQQARAQQQQATASALAQQQPSAAKLLTSQQQQARQQQALLLKQRQAAQKQQQQQQAHLQAQAVVQQQQYQAASQLQQQLAVQQQQQHQQMQTLLAAGQHLASGPHTSSAAVQDAVAKAAAAAAAASRAYGAAAASAAHQQQLLLMPQGSNTSTSSGFCRTSAAAPAGTTAFGAASANCMWQQLVQAQEQKSLLGAAAPVVHVQQQLPLLGTASSLTTSSSSTSSSSGTNIFASYLQHQQQAKARLQQQPPAKRAATQAAVAALLGASTAAAGQQHLAATRGSSNSLQTLALLHPSAASSAPRRAVFEANANRLLAWAGQVLGCQLQDAYHLAAHIFKRTAGRLDDMLLISLGATLPVDSVTMLVSLWLATKLEGHRRQVAGCSKLAGALQLLPWAVTSIELHMMQVMDWQPYAGWPLRPQEPSCTVAEY